GRGAHGPGEVRIFEEYCPIPRREVERLCHIILMKIIPAVVEGDISSFGEGLTEIQNVGFKRIEVSLQPPDVKELMDLMLKCGAAGAGMSSFGPAVFGVIDGWRSASSLLSNVEAFLSGRGEAFIAKVNNSGAQVLKESIVSLES
ncbi:MAG: beta-ribofuranosylaminobenzene 5'-phosphate synthase family protein, partial [Candidatus Freyarchaeota archaeon]